MFNFVKNKKIANTNKRRGNMIKMSMVRHNPHETQTKQFVVPFDSMAAKTVSLFSQPYLDKFNQCYKNIVVVNLPPQGPLGNLVKKVNFPPLSEFKQPGPCSPLKQCGFALLSLNGFCSMGCGKNGDNLMVVDEVPDLISFLVSNGYTVDTSITKMFNDSDISFDTSTGNKLICFITYNS
jgi:hypothetical protein